MLRGIISAVRAALGPRIFGWAGAKFAWGRTFFNYLLMRGLRRARAWPHALYVEVTNICNARCVFCAYGQMTRPKQVMDMELFRCAVDQYLRLGAGEVDLTPIVGEPLVDGRLFEKLDYLAAQATLRRFHFFTNAIALTPEAAQRLLGYGERLRVYISLGGLDREAYRRTFGVDQFERAAAHTRGLIEAKRSSGSALGVQVNLRTPREHNRGELWDYLRAAKRAGLIELTWMDAYDNWGGSVSEDSLRREGLGARPLRPRRGPCHRLLTSPAILADGRVNACACRDVEASLIIGDLRRESLADILGGAALHDMLRRHARGDFPEICRRCTYYDSVYPAWLTGQAAPRDPSQPVGV